AVDLSGHFLDLLTDGQTVFIERMEMALLIFQCIKYLFCQSDAALSAFFPHFGKCELTASLLAESADKLIFRLCICHKGVERYNNRHIVLLYVFNMLFKIH